MVPSGKESVAETVGGWPVRFGGGLGVDAQGEPGFGVTEAGLSRLDVDTFEDESGRIRPAEVVELGPLDSGLLSARIPDPVQPVRVVEVSPSALTKRNASVSWVVSPRSSRWFARSSIRTGGADRVLRAACDLGGPIAERPPAPRVTCSAMVTVERSKSIRPTRRPAPSSHRSPRR